MGRIRKDATLLLIMSTLQSPTVFTHTCLSHRGRILTSTQLIWWNCRFRVASQCRGKNPVLEWKRWRSVSTILFGLWHPHGTCPWCWSNVHSLRDMKQAFLFGVHWLGASQTVTQYHSAATLSVVIWAALSHHWSSVENIAHCKMPSQLLTPVVAMAKISQPVRTILTAALKHARSHRADKRCIFKDSFSPPAKCWLNKCWVIGGITKMTTHTSPSPVESSDWCHGVWPWVLL